MPKPMLNDAKKMRVDAIGSISTEGNVKLDSPRVESILRKKRSKNYMDVMRQLDLHGNQLSREVLDKFIQIIQEEFPDVTMSKELIGIVSKCYLGHPFEVHTLDIAGNIVVHYKLNEPLPPLLERARDLAASGSYDFIEVYIDCVRAISADGTVAVSK